MTDAQTVLVSSVLAAVVSLAVALWRGWVTLRAALAQGEAQIESARKMSLDTEQWKARWEIATREYDHFRELAAELDVMLYRDEPADVDAGALHGVRLLLGNCILRLAGSLSVSEKAWAIARRFDKACQAWTALVNRTRDADTVCPSERRARLIELGASFQALRIIAGWAAVRQIAIESEPDPQIVDQITEWLRHTENSQSA